MSARSRAMIPSPEGGHSPEPSRSAMVRRVLVLGSLTALGPLTIDLYLPAFPAISEQLDAAESAVQMTLTGTLIGIAIGQLVVGPLSDALGRRRPLIAATVVHVAASILCAMAPNIAALGAVRVLQGMAAAAGAVVSMAVVRDLYTGLPAVRLLSRLMLVTGVAPILAPTLGGLILQYTDWRGVFWVLAAIGGVLVAVVVIGLQETLPAEYRRSGGVVDTVRTYGSLLRDRTFVGLMLAGALMMAALFAYISGSSFIFQGIYGLSEQDYGVMFGVNSVGLVVATQLNARLVRRVGPQWILSSGLIAALLASGLMLVNALTGAFGFYGVAVPLFVLLSMVGFTMPNTPVLALANHGRTAGTAAALLGSMNFAVGALSAPLVGVLGTTSAVPMAGVMVMTTGMSVGVVFLIVRPARLAGLDRTPRCRTRRPAPCPEPCPAPCPAPCPTLHQRPQRRDRSGMIGR